MSGVKLWQACALSLNIDPDSLKTEPYQYGQKEPIFLTEYFPREGIAHDFKKRLQVLINRQWELRESGTSDDVPLAKVAELCASFGWEIPPEMGAMRTPAAPLKAVEKPELRVLPVPSETKEQRQDRRLQACIDAQLQMNTKSAVSRLPDGVGRVADTEGVSRQAFSADVKSALKRLKIAQKEGGTIHRT